uniref:Uncharacterized protein n=1 Tax=Zea mays TaxID=4577 RepID=A0A804MHY7_MAIZE
MQPPRDACPHPTPPTTVCASPPPHGRPSPSASTTMSRASSHPPPLPPPRRHGCPLRPSSTPMMTMNTAHSASSAARPHRWKVRHLLPRRQWKESLISSPAVLGRSTTSPPAAPQRQWKAWLVQGDSSLRRQRHQLLGGISRVRIVFASDVFSTIEGGQIDIILTEVDRWCGVHREEPTRSSRSCKRSVFLGL